MGKHIVVADCSWNSIEVEKKYLPQEATVEGFQCATEDEVIHACENADAILSEYAPITERVVKSLKKCKIISNTAIGVDNIDVKATTEKGIAVANVPGYCVNEVADHTMALILASNRNIVKYERKVRNQKWELDPSFKMKRLEGLTIGLIGFGRIPQYVAVRAQSFGLKVIAYDPFLTQEFASKFEVNLVEIDKLLMESDIISCHLPLTKDTIGFINKDKFAKMKKKPLFVNTSRGKVINEQDLIEAIEQGQISGAALDVLADEPPSFKSKIFKFDNVIITPHVGFYSETALEEVRRRSAQNVKNYFEGNFDKVNLVNGIKKITD
jgi:D-3-phosphoglycerate dehydrogenase